MSTQAYAAVPFGDSWRGRYIHSDGYPTWVGARLWRIALRDGVEAARKTLTEEYYGWSQIDDTTNVASKSYLGPDRVYAVEGYGFAYTPHDQDQDEWYGPEQADSWDWVYVLADDGLWVIKGSNHLGTFPWDGPEPDWKTIEEAN